MPASPPRSRPPLLTWAALLGLALCAPAALPAGGADRRLPELKRRESPREPLLNLLGGYLLPSPSCHAPPLAHLAPGVPLRVLRTWLEPDGRRWLQVSIPAPPGRPSRGWLLG